MWLIAGTVPYEDFGLCLAGLDQESILIGSDLVLPDGRRLPISRGTTALAATAILTCKYLEKEVPRLLLAGDTGKGIGSRLAYDWLAKNFAVFAQKLSPLQGLTFHYFYPDLDGHNRVLMAVEEQTPKPLLVADAGFMYVAKMSGYATSYDLFTPDLGELAFLADEKAPHPFYTRGFLLAEEKDCPALLKRALDNCNCPANLIIKGATDYIVCKGELEASISEPAEPAMECIGGTGDIVTGFVTAFLASGFPICKSAIMAAKAARCLGDYVRPNPATQVAELIANINFMLAKNMADIKDG